MTSKGTLLYHFTCLLHLPCILREGISRGEVPLSGQEVRQAPSLTSDPSPLALEWCALGSTDKTRVRLAVRVPAGDGRLQSWEEVCRQFGVGREWQRQLDTTGKRGKSWFVYWGVLPREWMEA